MQIEDAVTLIRSAVEGHEGTWADLGAGRGTFTRALASILGADSRIIAIDSDAAAVTEIEQIADPRVAARHDDFTAAFELPQLDGILLANSLHFVKDAGAVLKRLVERLASQGRVVLVEYDRRAASRWVPYPIGIANLNELATAAGLAKFRVVESRPSNYEGVLYCAVATKLQP